MIIPLKSIKMPKLQRRNNTTNDSTDFEPSLRSEEGKYICPSMNESFSISSDSSGASESTETWKSAGEEGHHKGEPWVAESVLEALQERGLNPCLDPKTTSQNAGNLKLAMKRAAELPRNTCFGNSHVMVNREREKCKVPFLSRSRELDEIARWHADAMAKASEGAFHAETTEILARLQKPWQRIGSNVGVGPCVVDIHMQMMRTTSMQNNILDRRYAEMGMATAKGQNGELYICQMFRG